MPSVDSAQDVSTPTFVRNAIQRYADFALAVTGAQDLRIEQVARSSLRVVFTSSEASKYVLLDKLERLKACGDDPRALSQEAPGEITPAYFDLVRFLSSSKVAMRIRRGFSEELMTLPVEEATAQAAALAVPRSTSERLEVSARVTSASISRSTIELEYGDGTREDMLVVQGSRHQIRGLRIGGEYSFDLVRTERKEHPSAPIRVEVEIQCAAPSLQVEGRAAERRPLVRRQVAALQWHKTLATTDAMRSASGHTRPYVPLTRSRYAIDHKTWFREGFFRYLNWEASGNRRLGDVAFAEISVIVSGISLGVDTLMLSHLPSRARHNNAPTTYLHWSPRLRQILHDNDVTGWVLILKRDKAGALSLRIEAPGRPQDLE
ncbi:MAG: hypothetical protein KF764_25540 [Labilithrix sp.]|nr:hypothetical protein [Labilithrix sp.]